MAEFNNDPEYHYRPIKNFINQITFKPMSNRKELIQAKLDEKSKVDFSELKIEDSRSIKKMINKQEDHLYDVRKSIKQMLSTPAIILGEEFVNLIREEKETEKELTLLNEILEKYV